MKSTFEKMYIFYNVSTGIQMISNQIQGIPYVFDGQCNGSMMKWINAIHSNSFQFILFQ